MTDIPKKPEDNSQREESKPEVASFKIDGTLREKLFQALKDTSFFAGTHRYDKDQKQEIHQDEETLLVPMGFAEVASSQDEKPYIGTTALDSCAGIAIYDSKNKVGGVAHVFFNDKISETVYARDSQGREIPRSGRAIIINNPLPFEPFKYLTDDLIRKAKEKGGEKYKVYVFNVRFGTRTKEQNEQLHKIADEKLTELQRDGKVTEVEYRNEQSFRLDTRTGKILPYSKH